jgi:hypothetical protein
MKLTREQQYLMKLRTEKTLERRRRKLEDLQMEILMLEQQLHWLSGGK